MELPGASISRERLIMDNYDYVSDKFPAFSWGQLSDAANLIRVMRKNDISADDFLAAVDEAVEEKRKQVRKNAVPVQPAFKKRTQKHMHKIAPRQYLGTLSCPKCGETAYAQPVCPGCAKGKAGIRREYICGDCNFVFYLD